MVPLELWGGPECSLNRVNDQYQDQFVFSGHRDRPEDLELFARLGLQKIRYPVLWESHQPEKGEPIDWSWADDRLGRIRALGMAPIVGLLHHGSGPAWCTFDQKEFPTELAKYARQVAECYPWVEHYTPVNEPLTTARFAGLYGFWYPHKQSDKAFVRIMLNQIKGTILAMRAIREVNPKAKLVQTEDLGKTQSTSKLAYQAEFENLRRWLTFDLLCGRLTKEHGLYAYLTKEGGATVRELQWFEDNALPPDIMGLNHYVTSERFLDHRTKLYPGRGRGSNGIHRYVDAETVRVKEARRFGFDYLMKETWVRYGLPIALTEVHMGCTREEQMRWFREAWAAAEFQHAAGVDIRGVTAWSLLGSYHWNCLLRHQQGCYETGVFDLRNNRPFRTAMTDMLQAIGTGETYRHPALEGKGWWDRPIRYGHHGSLDGHEIYKDLFPEKYRHEHDHRTILITGATGTLGQAFQKICRVRGLEFILTNRAQLDIGDPSSVEEALRRYRPWAVVNTAGYVRVDEAETDRDRCLRENVQGAENLARACARHHTRLVTFSSDLVFGGQGSGPYSEEDPTSPINVYGESKAIAEQAVLGLMPTALVVRTSAFFGPWDRYNFVHYILERGYRGEVTSLANDVFISPTYVPDLVNATLNLLIDGESGIWHLANHGRVSWYEFGRKVGRLADIDRDLLRPVSGASLGLAAARPADSCLISSRGMQIPDLDESLEKCVRELMTVFQAQEVPV